MVKFSYEGWKRRTTTRTYFSFVVKHFCIMGADQNKPNSESQFTFSFARRTFLYHFWLAPMWQVLHTNIITMGLDI
jgi:hypothetical protein